MIKNIQIDEALHRQVKLAALMLNTTIKEFTEAAIRAALPDKARLLVDSAAAYEVEEGSHDD